jgi:uncharacterized C2H2 Zn-finger protein
MLKIEVVKRTDGAGLLRCTRADGSVTWQKQSQQHAAHTTGKGARGPLPDEAGEVECIVGLFDSERGSGTLWTPDEFAHFAPRRLTRKLDEAAIRGIRSSRGDLFRRWAGVEIGGKLQLEYPS